MIRTFAAPTVLLALLLLTPLFVAAQFVPTIGTALQLQTIPRYPEPNSSVLVRAQNTPPSLGNTLFIWQVNGTVVDQGLGLDRLRVDLGPAGTQTSVKLTVSENGLIFGERTITLQPASIDIAWEGNTYTPPFYIGRPLPTGSSSVTLNAVPHFVQNGTRIDPSRLTYRWYVNSSQTPARVGVGASTLTIQPPRFENDFTVSVVAESPDGAQQAEKDVVINPVRPRVVLFEYSPLVGLRFETALRSNITLTEDEITVAAFPLFVNTLLDPEYVWHVGGKEVKQTGRNDRELTLRRSGDGGGSAQVEFGFESDTELFERGKANFRLSF